MAHPSSIVRGKVVTVPLPSPAHDPEGVASALTDGIHALERNSLGRVSFTEPEGDGPSVLVVSGTKQRSLRRWRHVLTPILDARGVQPDWSQALVLMAAAEPTHHD
nr:hypothetical protein [uncultured Pseudoxanthomonas sp.]